ncbi:phospholipase D-like domain-containing protein [Halorussus gelatinilyticus]|uniref:Phospholipase D-like domain-containing protein n=1 Tax=Halorussus gelatinilyticus TaxID=2937524 RepID=A0A8U0IF12_9EURY|nr:phospholipase D-like domain-containing protein [Halorussus gelatinilyticus]UPV99656.1 phospholipase D-like domain-containing protein [Halorussus gelatinilyticus]
MRSSPLTPTLVAVVLVAVVAGAVPTTAASAVESTAEVDSTANAADSPEIVAVFPNPVADGDTGESVALRVSGQTNLSDWALADGEATVSLPNATVSGRVAVSTSPRVARNRTDARVLALDGGLSLANGGETVRLVRGNATVGRVSYRDAPEGERWHRTDEARWRWTPLGATDFGVARTGPTEARAFVLPDAPEVPVETLRRADRRILLAGYSFASPRVADLLADAVRRGVAVRVLVDGTPVGGLSRRSAKILDSLVARGVEVRVLGGPRARYDFHHAKYAVADDRALVMTENWKPAGTGGHASRGWGAVVRSEAAAGRLAALFEADAGYRGAKSWSDFRRGESFTPAEGSPANETYPATFAPNSVNVSQTKVLIAPDNAEAALLDLLDSANRSIRVQQVAIGGRKHSLLRATLRAARRGVEVRILLSSAWYVAEDNRKLVRWLNDRATAENLSLDARLADPRGRYGKIHAKGVVVDGEAAVVGSLNWNNHSARKNREVAVVLRGEEAGGYYANTFDADWKASAGDGSGGPNRVPVGLLAAVAVGAIVAIAVAKREVVFEK